MMTQFFEMVLLQFIQEANEESCDYVVLAKPALTVKRPTEREVN